MSVTASDVLFAWDASHGIVPTVGGQPSFSRGGDKWVRTRTRGGGPLYQKVVGDQLGFSWVEKDGVLLPRRALDLEQAATPILDDTARFDSGSAWNRAQIGPERAVASIFAGLTGNAEAREFTDNQSGNLTLHQDVGTLSGGEETAVVIVEDITLEANAQSLWLGIEDTTSPAWVIRAFYDWAADSVSINDGSGRAYRKILTENGPNGGRVVLLVVTGSGTSGNNRRTEVVPVGFAEAGQIGVVHYIDHVEASFPTSPIPYAGSPLSRPHDDLYFEETALTGRVPLAGYTSFVAGADANAISGSDRLWQIHDGSGTNPKLSPFYIPTELRLGLWDAAGNVVTADLDIPYELGDLVEYGWVVRNGSGDLRAVARINGGTVSGMGTSGPSGGLEEFSGTRLDLQAQASGADTRKSHHQFVRHLGVLTSALDAAHDGTEDEALLNELADVPISPNRAGHAA